MSFNDSDSWECDDPDNSSDVEGFDAQHLDDGEGSSEQYVIDERIERQRAEAQNILDRWRTDE